MTDVVSAGTAAPGYLSILRSLGQTCLYCIKSLPLCLIALLIATAIGGHIHLQGATYGNGARLFTSGQIAYASAVKDFAVTVSASCLPTITTWRHPAICSICIPGGELVAGRYFEDW